VSDRRTPDATLIEAVRILARTINTDDGVIAACLGEVATRLAELVEERRWIEGRVVISRETFDKVVAALSRCTIVANDDGEEWNDEEVIDARDSIRRDAEKPLPPGPEGDGNG
jgi:hypothetical protein